MLVQGKRPRELHWYHAGPMLFGDWGTSRLYVLGLAFFYTQRASLWFMLAMSVLLVGVGWAYQIVCRIYPDGGGVYSSARHRSQTLAVIGGLLLCADYVVTAALSALDGFHYLNLPSPHVWALGSILGIGAVNYFGPKKSGTAALVVALLTVVLTFVVASFAFPHLKEAHLQPPRGNLWNWWAQFTRLVLAISGVEAVANMTGIMVRPVAQTARRAIWPVVVEIVTLNLVLTLAMLAVPDTVMGNGDPAQAMSAHRDDMLRLLATHYVGETFAAVASLVFALLLLSAVNTALTDLVSIQFMMSRDNELPGTFGKLNRWGMPLAPLVIATLVPFVVLMAVPDVGRLADLYAIGVVGAVAINLGTCATNMQVDIRRWERVGMGILATLMVAIWLTIAWEKPEALMFAMTVLAVGMTLRWTVHHWDKIRGWLRATAPAPPAATAAPKEAAPPSVQIVSEPVPEVAHLPPGISRIMVATYGSRSLVRFALQEAKAKNAELLVLFVRHLAVATMGPANEVDVRDDPEAQAFFEGVAEDAQADGVDSRFLYAVASHVSSAILSLATTSGVDELILGESRRGRVWHAVKGNTNRRVARHLPKGIGLVIHPAEQ